LWILAAVVVLGFAGGIFAALSGGTKAPTPSSSTPVASLSVSSS
jgi:hypothetical protein